jgi:MoxR-like ATPase
MSASIHSGLQRLQRNIESVVLGKQEVIRKTLIALLAGEHLLLEDVPGVGKTLVAKALAKSIDGKFTRVQFTPDLLPSDIVGSSIYHNGDFKFSPGPIFANIVLGDEINRAPPRTQSALLEAMSERQASIDGTTYPMPDPFMVIATQNPFEFEGTYVLPERLGLSCSRGGAKRLANSPDRGTGRRVIIGGEFIGDQAVAGSGSGDSV